MIDYFLEMPEGEKERLEKCASWANRASSVLAPGALTAHLFRFGAIDPALTEEFANQLAKGNEKIGGAKTLINVLTKLRQQNLGRIHELQVNALLIKTWNTLRKGDRVNEKTLTWTTQEEFPEIV